MKDSTGYALIVVLWSIVILTIVFVNLIDEAKLNSLLLRNNLQSRELKRAAVDGVFKGIDLLQTDKTSADTREDKWVQPFEFTTYSNVSCQVKIVDIGSKLNINYSSQDDLLRLQQLEWEQVKWNKLAEKLIWKDDLSPAEQEKKLGMIPQLSVLRSEFKSTADYEKMRRIFTTYGRFNPNLHQKAAWHKLLYFLKEKLDLSTLNQTMINSSSKRLTDNHTSQQKTKSFSAVEDFLKQAFPTDPTLRDKLIPYLSIKKRINVNFASEEVLQMILSRLKQDKLPKSSQETAQKIASYCAQHKVKKLSKLDQIGVGMISKHLENYLGTESSYLLIKSKAINQTTKQERSLEVVVHKIRKDEDKLKIQIVNWQEN